MTKEQLAALAQETSKTITEDTRKHLSDVVIPEVTEQVTKDVMAKVAQERSIGGSEPADKTNANKEFAEGMRAVAKGKESSIILETGTRAAAPGKPPVNTQTPGAGKEISREITAESIIKPHHQPGLVDRFAYRFPMAADTTNVPTIDAILAQRSKEGDLRSFGGMKTGMVNLHAATLSAIVPMNRELVDNAVEDMGRVFALLGSRAISLLRDKWALGFLGDNEGIFDNEKVQSLVLENGTKFSDLKHEDLVKAYGMLDDEAINPMAVMHRSVKAALMTEKTATGNYVWDWSLAGANKLAFGEGVETSSLLPGLRTSVGEQAGKEFALLGDLSNIIQGVAQKVEITVADQAILSDDAGKVLFNAYQQRMYFFMISVREDIVLHNPEKNFVTLKTAAAATGS
jgi:HK97 family phage major capsid protein